MIGPVISIAQKENSLTSDELRKFRIEMERRASIGLPLSREVEQQLDRDRLPFSADPDDVPVAVPSGEDADESARELDRLNQRRRSSLILRGVRALCAFLAGLVRRWR